MADSDNENRGHAPGALKQFWWDLLPKRSPDWLVPPRSGLRPPAEIPVDWITPEIANQPEALAQTRRAHDFEQKRVASLEAKGSTMVNLCLTLLAIALATAGYEIRILR